MVHSETAALIEVVKTLSSLESALSELEGNVETAGDVIKTEALGKKVERSAIPRRHLSVSSRLGG